MSRKTEERDSTKSRGRLFADPGRSCPIGPGMWVRSSRGALERFANPTNAVPVGGWVIMRS